MCSYLMIENQDSFGNLFYLKLILHKYTFEEKKLNT